MRIVNLAPNPKTVSTSPSAPTPRWNTKMKDVNDGLELYVDEYPAEHLGIGFGYNPDIAFAGTGKGRIPIPQSGDYVMCIHVRASEPTEISTAGRLSDESGFIGTGTMSKTSNVVSDDDIVREFTVPSACSLNVIVETSGQATSPIVVSRMLVCTKRDWRDLNDLGMSYFDYATMPREAGGGGIPPSPLAARAVRRYQWGLAA